MNISLELEKGVTTNSPEETARIASGLATVIPVDTVVALYGDLGSGKTAFVKGLAKGWNIRETVKSPTYNIFTFYRGSRNLIHLDAYRIEGSDAVDELMLEDFLRNPYCLAIEWPENIIEALPENRWNIYCSILDYGKHHFRLAINPV